MTAASGTPFVMLEVSGPGLSALDLARRLGIPPTAANAPVGPAPGWGFWTLDSRDQVPGNRLADHLRWLVDRLGGVEGAVRDFAATGRVRLLAYGRPETWALDAEGDEAERVRLGVPLSFVVFVKGDQQIKVGHVAFGSPEGAA